MRSPSRRRSPRRRQLALTRCQATGILVCQWSARLHMTPSATLASGRRVAAVPPARGRELPARPAVTATTRAPREATTIDQVDRPAPSLAPATGSQSGGQPDDSGCDLGQFTDLGRCRCRPLFLLFEGSLASGWHGSGEMQRRLRSSLAALPPVLAVPRGRPLHPPVRAVPVHCQGTTNHEQEETP